MICFERAIDDVEEVDEADMFDVLLGGDSIDAVGIICMDDISPRSRCERRSPSEGVAVAQYSSRQHQ